jgi:hypothetical protein
MQKRLQKKRNKAIWIAKRNEQKIKVRNVKLNIIGAVLKRFYAKFLGQTKLVKQEMA